MLQRLTGFLSNLIKPHPKELSGATLLYRKCVAQIRQPLFYNDWVVPDTFDGRFDLLLLHVILVTLRIPTEPHTAQQLFNLMFKDVDQNLRQMGVSDIRISARMKPLLAAYYGRAAAYEEALGLSDQQLSEALQRNVYGTSTISTEKLAYLTAYTRHLHRKLATLATETIIKGEISFPNLTNDMKTYD